MPGGKTADCCLGVCTGDREAPGGEEGGRGLREGPDRPLGGGIAKGSSEEGGKEAD